MEDYFKIKVPSTEEMVAMAKHLGFHEDIIECLRHTGPMPEYQYWDKDKQEWVTPQINEDR